MFFITYIRIKLCQSCPLLVVQQKFWTVTSVGVASFDVAGDANDRQSVDTAQTKDQCEKTIHLEEANTLQVSPTCSVSVPFRDIKFCWTINKDKLTSV